MKKFFAILLISMVFIIQTNDMPPPDVNTIDAEESALLFDNDHEVLTMNLAVQDHVKSEYLGEAVTFERMSQELNKGTYICENVDAKFRNLEQGNLADNWLLPGGAGTIKESFSASAETLIPQELMIDRGASMPLKLPISASLQVNRYYSLLIDEASTLLDVLKLPILVLHMIAKEA